MNVPITIKKLRPDAALPSYAHPGDVGLDVRALEDYTLRPGERHLFPLGFALEFPAGYAVLVKDRGSMARAGLHTTGGVFDAGYRGEYNIQLVNLGHKNYEVKTGHKIAQLIVFPVACAQLSESAELSDSSRGHGKFGSTGI